MALACCYDGTCFYCDIAWPKEFLVDWGHGCLVFDYCVSVTVLTGVRLSSSPVAVLQHISCCESLCACVHVSLVVNVNGYVGVMW